MLIMQIAFLVGSPHFQIDLKPKLANSKKVFNYAEKQKKKNIENTEACLLEDLSKSN